MPDIKINQNNSRRIEEEKEPPQIEKPIQDIVNLSQNKNVKLNIYSNHLFELIINFHNSLFC